MEIRKGMPGLKNGQITDLKKDKGEIVSKVDDSRTVSKDVLVKDKSDVNLKVDYLNLMSCNEYNDNKVLDVNIPESTMSVLQSVPSGPRLLGVRKSDYKSCATSLK